MGDFFPVLTIIPAAMNPSFPISQAALFYARYAPLP
jgi:hypothetical protein